MKTVVLDANILLRLAEPQHPLHAEVLTAVEELRRRNDTVVLFPQIVYEFWAVATRTVAANGLGIPAVDADLLIQGFLRRIPLVFDNQAVFETWRQLVSQHAVTGVNSHDVRIVAAMMAHGIPTLLTLNARDFTRYSGIEILAPQAVIATGSPETAEG